MYMATLGKSAHIITFSQAPYILDDNNDQNYLLQKDGWPSDGRNELNNRNLKKLSLNFSCLYLIYIFSAKALISSSSDNKTPCIFSMYNLI